MSNIDEFMLLLLQMGSPNSCSPAPHILMKLSRHCFINLSKQLSNKKPKQGGQTTQASLKKFSKEESYPEQSKARLCKDLTK